MTREDMWKLINQEQAEVKDMQADMEKCEANITRLGLEIDEAFKTKDSKKAFKLGDDLEAEKRKYEVYRNINVAYANGANITVEEFNTEMDREVTQPYLKRKSELLEELENMKQAYIVKLHAAHDELEAFNSLYRDYMDINAKANLDLNISYIYAKNDLRGCFIESSPYFFASK